MKSVSLLSTRRKAIKSLVVKMRSKKWSKVLKSFLCYKQNVKRMRREKEIEEYKHKQMNNMKQELLTEISIRRGIRMKIVLKGYFIKWIKFNKESIMKDYLISSYCKRLSFMMYKKLIELGIKPLLNHWQNITAQRESVRCCVKVLMSLYKHKQLRSAFTKYKNSVWNLTRKTLNIQKKIERLLNIINKTRMLTLRSASNLWRFTSLNNLKGIATQYATNFKAQEEVFEHKKFLAEVHVRSLSLLEYEYQTVDDVLSSQALAGIVKDIKAFICRKLNVDECVLSLFAPIPALLNSSGPYLLLQEPQVDSALYRATVDNLKRVRQKNFRSATRVKSQELNAKLAIPSVFKDDPIITQSMGKYFDTMKEPYVAALKHRRVEMMKTGIAFPIDNPQGTLELYWISQYNDPINVTV